MFDLHFLRTCAFALILRVFFISLAIANPASAQSIQSRFADANGVRLHYLVAGKGEPVVLLHGFALMEEAPGQVIPRLVEFIGR